MLLVAFHNLFLCFATVLRVKDRMYLIVVTVQALLAALGLPCSLFQHLPASLQLMVVSLVAQLARYRHISTHIYISTVIYTVSTLIYTHLYPAWWARPRIT